MDYVEPSDLAYGGKGRLSGITGAERELASLGRVTGLSKDGRMWLEAALDPFHDRALECSGYPSLSATRTLVQQVKKSMTITAPVGTTGTWDCNIVNLQHDVTMPMYFCTTSGNNVATGARYPMRGSSGIVPGTFAELGTIVAVSCESGVRTFMPPAIIGAYPPGDLNFQSLSPARWSGVENTVADQPYSDGYHRIISMGFEVINTTPPISAGGSSIIYRQNADARPTLLGGSVGGVAGGLAAISPAFNATLIMAPPGSPEEALNLRDSRMLSATEGAYVPAVMCSTDNPLTLPIARYPFYVSPEQTAGATGAVFGNSITVGGSGGGVYPGPMLATTPFHQSGVYFTGLSSGTSLTVNVRFLIERAPTTQEPDLVVLATPSPFYDPVAFQLYALAARLAPPGVPLDENFLGDWFRSIVGTLRNTVLPAVQGALPIIQGILGGPEATARKQRQSATTAQKKKRAKALRTPALTTQPPITSRAMAKALRARSVGLI